MTPRHYGLGVLTLVSLFALSSVQAGPLHDAADKGNIDEVKRLIAQGANVNAKDKHTVTALHWAADQGHTAVVELLIAEGADVNAKSKDGSTPLWAATDGGHKDVANLLKRHGGKK